MNVFRWLQILLTGTVLIGPALGASGQAIAAPVLPVSVLTQSPADTKTDL